MPQGTLQVFTNLADSALALSNVVIRVFKEENKQIVFETYFMTNIEGQSPIIHLDTISKDLSLDETNSKRPYETYNVEAILDGYVSEVVQGVQIFADEISTLPLYLVPNVVQSNEKTVETIVDHHLLTNYGGNNVSQDPSRFIQRSDPDYRLIEEEQLKTPERNNFVLKGVVIPRRIRVHLGRPTSSAENVNCDFIYYIKNVCSSEVYPTWPKEALLANIHAQVSLALNRIYTEWYPSKGFDFDITNNTAFDQAFVKNRNIYDTISVLVDDVFNQFLRKGNFAEPFYAEYCDGKIAQCPGMKQWGTFDLANQGYSAIQILQYYYTPNVRLVSSDRIEDVKGSYPGTPLREGSSGSAVYLLQQQLNAIAVNYPLIKPIYPVDGIFGPTTTEAVRVFQKQFNLGVDGVVGKGTWYKVNYIYVAVRKLAELTSIGRIENDLSGQWPGINLSSGDRDVYVQQIQYYLSTIATFNDAISPIQNIDSTYGPQTINAVRTFQQYYGLTVDGVVGQATWDRIFAVYKEMIGIVNPEVLAPVYPGNPLKLGASGNDVLEVQEALNTIGIENSSIQPIVEDGIFGTATDTAVRTFQEIFGLPVDGIVGPNTWTALFEAANSITTGGSSTSSFPTFPGTPLRVGSRGNAVSFMQERLRFISIYYTEIPSPGAIDGIYGRQTEQAVRAFQQLLGLSVDGIVGTQTWNRMMQVFSELKG